ncbi:MAG: riboflavin biosynthesis protein RibF [Opitutaceae bacterium]
MKRTFTLGGLAEAASLPAKPLYLAIGMFDGVHLGHRAVISAAVQSAQRGSGLSAVLTFWPHPSRLFRPEDPVRQIQRPEVRARQLFSLGVDVVITEPFTAEFAALEAEAFVPSLRRALSGLRTIYVGENWRFGRGRRGDVSLLLEEGRKAGLSVFSAPRVNFDGEPVSSTRIRRDLETGEISRANSMLGYSYFAEGVVTPGKRLGRTLGFPTLNLSWDPELRPRFGVYVVRIRGKGLRGWLPAVANYGVRPTVEATLEPRLEVHVLGTCTLGDGDEIEVQWLTFLRPEMKFAGLDALKSQIEQDRARALAFFAQKEG